MQPAARGDIRAIFLDIDGTLLFDAHKPPVQSDIAALRRARLSGHKVFINTGRARAILPDVLRGADYIDGFLCGCGTHLIMDGRTVFAAVLPAEALRSVTRACLASGRRCVYEGEDVCYATFDCFAGALPVTRADDFDTRYAGARVTKLTVMGAAVTTAERALLSPWFTFINMPGYFEAILRGHSKGEGLARVCALLGIPSERAIAIGDSRNDMDMIQRAGTGVAMGNACAELRALAQHVTGACGQGGVGRAVESLLFGKSG